MNAIHQFTAGFTNGDAITHEALFFRAVFRSWGCRSDIFSEPNRILPELRRQALDVADYAANSHSEDAVLLHLSIGSPVNEAFRTLRCRKAILYHNITPPHYFELFNPQTARNLQRGCDQMKSLSDATSINLAHSRFSADALRTAGYRAPAVIPFLTDLAAMASLPDRKTLRHFRDGRTNVLFVGRCAPNKCIEDLLRAFAYFQKTVEPFSRLIHVGSFAGTERYYYLMLAMSRELGLNHCHFAGSVPRDQLNAFYRSADVFLCASEHEGFCVPLIESMAMNVPVVAYAAAAVPETLDGAGVLFREKRWDLVAEIMGRLVRDTSLRSAVLRQQRERIDRYSAQDFRAELRVHLEPLLRAPSPS